MGSPVPTPSLPSPVPLAWLNLTHDRVRFVLYAAGIGFAVVLMGVQLGIMNAMLDSNTMLLRRLDADLVLVNPTRQSLLFRQGVSRRRAEQARQVPGVADVVPVYVEYQLGLLRHTADAPQGRSQTRRVRVVGVDPDAGILRLPDVPAEDWRRLRVPGTALYDRKSRPHPDPIHHPGETVFGRLADGVRTELSGRQITLVGHGFALGFDFAADGTLVVSDRTFARWVRGPYTPPGVDPLADSDLVAVRLVPGADPVHVRDQLRRLFAPARGPDPGEAAAPGPDDPDVDVLTRDELIAREKQFWWRNTPIGFAFGAGVALGFVVGLVICYQILTGDVADHAAEYATLKAIGYGNGYLGRVVLEEALILAVGGYLPGLLVTAGTFALLTRLTGLPMELTVPRAGLVFVLTVAMCAVSGWLAIGRVQKVDPADVF